MEYAKGARLRFLSKPLIQNRGGDREGARGSEAIISEFIDNSNKFMLINLHNDILMGSLEIQIYKVAGAKFTELDAYRQIEIYIEELCCQQITIHTSVLESDGTVKSEEQSMATINHIFGCIANVASAPPPSLPLPFFIISGSILCST